MTLILGLVIIVASVIGGFAALGGRTGVLWQPYEVLIICGAAFGAFIIATPRELIMAVGRQIMRIAQGATLKPADHLDMLSLLFTLFRQIKSKGVASVENDVEDPVNSALFNRFPRAARQTRAVRFLCDYVRLISLGSERPHELEALMDEEIETLSKQYRRIVKSVEAMSDTLPALGIVAAVLGVIKAMGYINQAPEVLGTMIGGALVGTFLGVILAYGVVTPLAHAIRHRLDADLSVYVSVKAGLIAYLNGAPPQIAVEFARKVLTDDVQPSFDALEAATRASAQAGAGPTVARAAA